MKIEATLTLGSGLLVPESGPVTVESYDAKIAVRDYDPEDAI